MRVERLGVLGTPAEPRFDRLTRAAALALDVPIVALSIVGEERVWVKSAHGAVVGWVPRTETICTHALPGGETLEIVDPRLDDRAKGLVQGAYLGVPIGHGPDGSALAVICAVNATYEPFSAQQKRTLEAFASLTEQLLNEPPAIELAERLLLRVDAEAKARAELVQRNERLRVLGEIASLGAGRGSPTDVLEAALAAAARLAPEVRVSWSSLEDNGAYVTLASVGPPSMRKTAGLSGTVAMAPEHLADLLAGRPVVTNDFLANQRTQGLADDWGAIDVRASVEFAVQAKRGGWWLMCLDSSTPRAWDSGFVDVIEEVTRQIALVLHAAEAQAELEKTSARFATVLATQDSGVLVENEKREVVLVNAACMRIIGVEADPSLFVGRSVPELFRPAAGAMTFPGFVERLDALLAAGERVTGEVVLLPDGRVFERDFVPVRMNGRPAGIMWQYRDVTRRYREHEQLEAARNAALEANRAKADFLATISHEIRTPLNGVLGTLSLVLDDVDPRHEPLVRTATDSAGLLLRLLNDILDASKMDAGKLSLEREPFSPRDVLEQTRLLFSSKAATRGLSLSLELDEALPPFVVGDVHRFQQIVTNLVSNALKFTETGSVRVRGGQRNGAVLVEVEDTGPGVPDMVVAHLFEKFRQGDGSRTRRHGGAGLGLAISSGLAALMGGTLRHVPTPVGAKFEVELPLPACDRLAVATPAPTHQRFDGVRVLVVDDNAVNRLVAVSHLEKLGCVVDAANDGAQAVERVAATDYDVVFMDCHMPVLDGFEATRQLRRDHGTSLPIIALTASALAEDVRQCHESGMDSVVTKPVKRADFVVALRKYAHRQQADAIALLARVG